MLTALSNAKHIEVETLHCNVLGVVKKSKEID